MSAKFILTSLIQLRAKFKEKTAVNYKIPVKLYSFLKKQLCNSHSIKKILKQFISFASIDQRAGFKQKPK